MTQVMNLMIVNVNKDHTIFPQEIPGEVEAGVHHAEPVRVKMAALPGVLSEQIILVEIALIVHLVDPLEIGLFSFGEVVGIDKGIVAGIVRRVDVDALDLAGVVRQQGLERQQVVALDKQVPAAGFADAIRAVKLMVSKISDAIIEGRTEAESGQFEEGEYDASAYAAEPMPTELPEEPPAAEETADEVTA